MDELGKFILVIGVVGALLWGASAIPDIFDAQARIEEAQASQMQSQVAIDALRLAQAQFLVTGLLVVGVVIIAVVLAVVVLAGAIAIYRWQLAQGSQLQLPPGERQRLNAGQEPGVMIIRNRGEYTCVNRRTGV